MYLPTYLRYILTSTGTKLVQSTDRGPNYVAPVVFTYLDDYRNLLGYYI